MAEFVAWRRGEDQNITLTGSIRVARDTTETNTLVFNTVATNTQHVFLNTQQFLGGAEQMMNNQLQVAAQNAEQVQNFTARMPHTRENRGVLFRDDDVRQMDTLIEHWRTRESEFRVEQQTVNEMSFRELAKYELIMLGVRDYRELSDEEDRSVRHIIDRLDQMEVERDLERDNFVPPEHQQEGEQ